MQQQCTKAGFKIAPFQLHFGNVEVPLNVVGNGDMVAMRKPCGETFAAVALVGGRLVLTVWAGPERGPSHEIEIPLKGGK